MMKTALAVLFLLQVIVNGTMLSEIPIEVIEAFLTEVIDWGKQEGYEHAI